MRENCKTGQLLYIRYVSLALLKYLAIMHLQKHNFNEICNLYYIQTFECSTLFTNISHENIKTCFNQLIHNASYFNNGKPYQRFTALSHSRINLLVRLKRQNMLIIENIFVEL